MRFVRPIYCVSLCLAGAVAAGCGADRAITGPDPTLSPNYVLLVSDSGDFVGGGGQYDYSQADAIISVTARGGRLSIRIDGDEQWAGDFQSPDSLDRLQAGDYANLKRFPFHDPAVGGLSWFGEGRGCNTLTGEFIVDSVTYDGDSLTAIDMSFAQYCESSTTALHGTIHWRSDDPTVPPGPVKPVPDGLWQPPRGSVPPRGNYVYLVSDAGDFIGAGRVYAYSPSSDMFTMTANGGHLSVRLTDGEQWSGEFQAMNTLHRLEPGYYPDLRRYPFHNPVKGGLDWSGQSRGCNVLLGWFAIDRIVYSGGKVTALDLRFEQHCEGGPSALHGAIHWG